MGHGRAAGARGRRERWWRVPTVVFALAVAVVAMIAEGVLEHDDLASYDPRIGRWFIGERSTLLTPPAGDLAVIGGPVGLPVLVVVAVVWLWVRRFRGEAVFVALTMASSAVITSLMKLAFARPRPSSDVIGALSRSFSFPSGHTVNTTVFVGLLGLLAWRSVASRAARVAIVGVWLGASVLMALSRVYLASHWFTDVLGGLATGVGILAAAVLARRLVARRAGDRTPVTAPPDREE